MKVLHSADWHIRDKNIDEARECLECLISTAVKKNVDLVVVSGDCFDSRDIKMDSKAAKLVIKTVSQLANIAPVAIVTGTASHDGAAPEILRYARGKYDVHVSTYPEQVRLIDGYLYNREAGDGSEIVEALVTLIPQPTKQFFSSSEDIQTSNEQISNSLSGLFAGFGAAASEYRCPHLLVYHGSIRGAKLSNDQVLTGIDIEVSADQLSLANADINLCGHIHLSQQLGEKTFYPGSIFPLNWGENHDHGFYIHEIG
jgi:DNA repair exonuclease SbcCD nuclease subunit